MAYNDVTAISIDWAHQHLPYPFVLEYLQGFSWSWACHPSCIDLDRESDSCRHSRTLLLTTCQCYPAIPPCIFHMNCGLLPASSSKHASVYTQCRQKCLHIQERILCSLFLYSFSQPYWACTNEQNCSTPTWQDSIGCYAEVTLFQKVYTMHPIVLIY